MVLETLCCVFNGGFHNLGLQFGLLLGLGCDSPMEGIPGPAPVVLCAQEFMTTALEHGLPWCSHNQAPSSTGECGWAFSCRSVCWRSKHQCKTGRTEVKNFNVRFLSVFPPLGEVMLGR